MQKLSDNLKRLLNQVKISENELARRTGVPQQVINRILSGENTNPKISTISPLANYFMISISELIGDIQSIEIKLNTQHQGWQEVPLIDWDKLNQFSLHDLIAEKEQSVLLDVNNSNKIFALKMQGSSMEPKFTEGTLLIFDYSTSLRNADFGLFQLSSHEIVMRQIFIKSDRIYVKCLNPEYKDYKLSLLKEGFQFLGSLIQSRTNYID
jgi:transcriptional regulator with XRE-family HTH domain